MIWNPTRLNLPITESLQDSAPPYVMGFFQADGVGFVDEYDRLLIEDEIGVSGDEE